MRVKPQRSQFNAILVRLQTGLSALSLFLTLAAGPAAAQTGQVIEAWYFNDPAGNAPNGRTTLSTRGTVATIRGAGASFTGTGVSLPGGSSTTAAYVDLPNGFISALNDTSFEFWVTVRSHRTWQRIFDFGTGSAGELTGPGGSASGSGKTYLFLSANRGNSPNTQRFEFNVQGSGVDTNHILTLNVMHHVVVTFDDRSDVGQPNVAKWYLNGVLKATYTNNQRLRTLVDVNNWLGRSQYTTDSNSDMLYDSLAVYDTALTDAQVNTQLNAGPDVPAFDTDGDGVSNDFDADDDNDGQSDADEEACGSEPLRASSKSPDDDGDNVPDCIDIDNDNDGTADTADNCPRTYSHDQSNTDGDAEGDACDADDDNDGAADSADNCPLVANADQADADDDGIGDTCDPADNRDRDADGVPDAADNCPVASNPGQADTDGDAEGDACDADDDNDGAADSQDAFPLDSKESVDTDGDGTGNSADTDDDGDGVADAQDAFPLNSSESVDTDGDGTGNNADTDDDGDGAADANDAFPLDARETADTDGDGTGNNADADDDGDGQRDADEISCGSDALSAASKSPDNDRDNTPDCADADDDNDGVADASDNCSLNANQGQLDTDKDGAGDVCDANGVYKFRALYDPMKAAKSGSTIPVKLQVVDSLGANLSSQGLVVNAVAVRLVGQAYGEVQDAGSANPDMNFRYDPTLGGYIFNLKTTGLEPGAYLLYFNIGGDSYFYTTPFQVR